MKSVYDGRNLPSADEKKEANCLLLFFLILKILIEIAGNHAVVELADLVGAFAVEAFKAFVGGDDVDLPGGKTLETAADGAV